MFIYNKKEPDKNGGKSFTAVAVTAVSSIQQEKVGAARFRRRQVVLAWWIRRRSLGMV